MDVPDVSAQGSVALGIIVGLVSTSIQSVGLTLQRKSHILEEEKEEQDGVEIRPPYRRRRWQLGMAMFLISNIVGSTIQITTLPLPVLSTLQASGLVFNTACATLILSEPFTRYSLIGTALVAAGAILIAIFGALAEPSHNLDQLLFLLGRREFLIWLVATFLVAGGVIITIWFSSRLHTRATSRYRLILGMSYGGVSGILSAHTLLLAKSAVELLVRTIADKVNQFNRWQSWMILLGLVFLALSQLYYLHRGLKLCSTSVLYPFVFCVYNIIAILDGLIYFDQSSRLSITHGALIAVGTVILLAGVFALSWRLSDDPDPRHRSMSISGHLDTKSLAHGVPPPQTALGPGLGLVDVESNDAIHLHLADDEEADIHTHPPRPNEATPLLRSTTMPIRRQSSLKGQSRPSQTRRLTLQEAQTDLWDELNDRRSSEATWHASSAAAHSPARSPTASRHSSHYHANQHNRKPGSSLRRPGTMPSQRSTLQIPVWNFTWTRPRPREEGRRSWSSGGQGARSAEPILEGNGEADSMEIAAAAGESSSASPLLSTQSPDLARAATGSGQGGARRISEPAAVGGKWFSVNWWRQRWRDGEE